MKDKPLSREQLDLLREALDFAAESWEARAEEVDEDGAVELTAKAAQVYFLKNLLFPLAGTPKRP